MPVRLEDTVPFLLYRVASKVSGAANTDYRAMGINLMSARALITLLNGPTTVGALALATGIDQPTLSHIVKRLVRDKLAVKQRLDRDNRSVRVELMPQGRDLARRCMKHNRRYEALVTARLTKAQTRSLKAMLKQMFANVEKLSGDERTASSAARTGQPAMVDLAMAR